jgi:hypothetical protein
MNGVSNAAPITTTSTTTTTTTTATTTAAVSGLMDPNQPVLIGKRLERRFKFFQAAKNLANNAVNTVKNVATKAKNAGKNVATKAKNLVTKAGRSVAKAGRSAKNVAAKAVKSGKKALGIGLNPEEAQKRAKRVKGINRFIKGISTPLSPKAKEKARLRKINGKVF